MTRVLLLFLGLDSGTGDISLTNRINKGTYVTEGNPTFYSLPGIYADVAVQNVIQSKV